MIHSFIAMFVSWLKAIVLYILMYEVLQKFLPYRKLVILSHLSMNVLEWLRYLRHTKKVMFLQHFKNFIAWWVLSIRNKFIVGKLIILWNSLILLFKSIYITMKFGIKLYALILHNRIDWLNEKNRQILEVVRASLFSMHMLRYY